MVELPDNEEINQFRVGEAVERANKELMDSDVRETKEEREDFETDLDLKSNLLDLRAKELNPDLNKQDLVLSYINPKDKLHLEPLLDDIDFACTLYGVGFNESSRFLSSSILTKMNFQRSVNGNQQMALITRIKAQQLNLQKENESFTDNFKRRAASK